MVSRPSPPDRRARAADDESTQTAPRTGAILIVEDDREVREHLKLFLNEEGYQTSTAVDGHDALGLLARGTTRPDLVLAGPWAALAALFSVRHLRHLTALHRVCVWLLSG